MIEPLLVLFCCCKHCSFLWLFYNTLWRSMQFLSPSQDSHWCHADLICLPMIYRFSMHGLALVHQLVHTPLVHWNGRTKLCQYSFCAISLCGHSTLFGSCSSAFVTTGLWLIFIQNRYFSICCAMILLFGEWKVFASQNCLLTKNSIKPIFHLCGPLRYDDM